MVFYNVCMYIATRCTYNCPMQNALIYKFCTSGSGGRKEESDWLKTLQFGGFNCTDLHFHAYTAGPGKIHYRFTVYNVVALLCRSETTTTFDTCHLGIIVAGYTKKCYHYFYCGGILHHTVYRREVCCEH
jgi:hypothetical protein